MSDPFSGYSHVDEVMFTQYADSVRYASIAACVFLGVLVGFLWWPATFFCVFLLYLATCFRYQLTIFIGDGKYRLDRGLYPFAEKHDGTIQDLRELKIAQFISAGRYSATVDYRLFLCFNKRSVSDFHLFTRPCIKDIAQLARELSVQLSLPIVVDKKLAELQSQLNMATLIAGTNQEEED